MIPRSTSQLSSGLSIKIYGSDVNTLTALSEKVVDIVNSTPGFANATNGLGAGDSTIILKVDRDKVRAYGLTVAEVYQKIAQRLTTTATAQTPVTVDGTTMDVKITNDLDPLTKENMMDMTFDTSVLNTDGETVTGTCTLADIATWETGTAPDSITSENRNQFVTVTAETAPGYNTTVQARAVKKALDAFEDELETYLVKISSMQLSLENSMQVSKLSHAIGNFERIGDYAVNILKTKRTMHEDKIHFSKEASKELEVMSSAVQEIITKATNAFIENDVAAAQTIEPLEQVIDNLKAELRARHTKRLQAGECTIETGMLFFDIINSFERIADHCSNLAVCIIELSQGSYQTHRYLKSVKSQENARFMKSFEDYLRKYALH